MCYAEKIIPIHSNNVITICIFNWIDAESEESRTLGKIGFDHVIDNFVVILIVVLRRAGP